MHAVCHTNVWQIYMPVMTDGFIIHNNNTQSERSLADGQRNPDDDTSVVSRDYVFLLLKHRTLMHHPHPPFLALMRPKQYQRQFVNKSNRV